MKKQSKKAKILRYLQDGNTLTHNQCLSLFKVSRLSSVINRIRDDFGYDCIDTITRYDNEGTQYGEYKWMSK